MDINLSIDDILFAAVLALFLTWMVQSGLKIYKSISSKSTEFKYNRNDFDKILKKCCLIFPVENINFNGKIFNRGMNVRVVTNQNKVIEGRLIGQNKENVMCILTDQHIVAHDLKLIEEMLTIEKQVF